MTKKFPLKEKGLIAKSGEKVLGIQIKCPRHDWQRVIYIKGGIGCSYCYDK